MQKPTLEGIRAAAERIRAHVAETPLVRAEVLSERVGAEVWLKNETVTAVASFKLRGALNAMLLAKQAGVQAVATSSTGNHGQGVAYSGRLLDMRARIFLPQPVNPVKAAKIELFGGEIEVCDGDIDAAKDAASAFCREHGGTFIDDGNDVAVMEGAGTIGLEVAERLPDIDAMIVPLGGGNLSAGTAVGLKSLQPGAKLYSVQAKGSPAVTESYHAREKLERPTDSIADGLVTRVPPDLALEVLWERLDDAWLADDETLLAGVRSLIESAQVLVEPAGSAALVGLWRNREALRGKRVVLLVTGANITREHLERALQGPALL